MSKLRFRFTAGESEHTCEVHCQQCTAIGSNGRRCKLRTCVSLPYCWIHAKKLLNVAVKTSTIPGAGLGLFTTARIPRGAWVAPLLGEEVDEATVTDRYGEYNAPYVLEIDSTGTMYDGACMKYVGHNANAMFGNVMRSGRDAGKRRSVERGTNARIALREGEPWIRAKAAIQPNTEVLVNYGREYLLDPDVSYEYYRGRR